jgi:hypothetical protein
MRNGFSPWVRALGGVDWWKNRRSKISWQCPFKITVCIFIHFLKTGIHFLCSNHITILYWPYWTVHHAVHYCTLFPFDHSAVLSLLLFNHSAVLSLLLLNHSAVLSLLLFNHSAVLSLLLLNHSAVLTLLLFNHSAVLSPLLSFNHSAVLSLLLFLITHLYCPLTSLITKLYSVQPLNLFNQ